MELDKTDEKIVAVLQENAKLSYRQIAKKVNISVATVLNRVKKLEREGIIKKYTVLLDYEKLGFDVPVLVDIRVAKGKLFNVEKKIATHPNVFAIYDKTGAFDATIVAKFKNRKSMDHFIKTIQTYDFIERTETQLILNTIKEEGIRL
jgi:Lrp/AsnC family transcriptional regulator for asnA, asnC and gidA